MTLIEQQIAIEGNNVHIRHSRKKGFEAIDEVAKDAKQYLREMAKDGQEAPDTLTMTVKVIG